MNFCSNCGNKREENTKFCPNCGIRFENVNTANNIDFKKIEIPEEIKNRLHNIKEINYEQMKDEVVTKVKDIPQKFFIIAAVVVTTIFFLYNFTSLFDSKEKTAFMNSYNKAVELTSKTEYGMSNVELDKLDILNTYNGIDIQKDKEVNIKLLGIFMMMRGEYSEPLDTANTLSELLEDFDKNFKNYDSRILDASKDFRDDTEKLIEFLKIYSKAEIYYKEKDESNLKKAIKDLEKFEFKTTRLKTLREFTYTTSHFNILNSENSASEGNRNLALESESTNESVASTSFERILPYILIGGLGISVTSLVYYFMRKRENNDSSPPKF